MRPYCPKIKDRCVGDRCALAEKVVYQIDYRIISGECSYCRKKTSSVIKEVPDGEDIYGDLDTEWIDSASCSECRRDYVYNKKISIENVSYKMFKKTICREYMFNISPPQSM